MTIKEKTVAVAMEKSSENAALFGQYCKHMIMTTSINN